MEMLKLGVAVPESMAAVRAFYERRALMQGWRSIGHGLDLTIYGPPRIGGTSTAMLSKNVVVIEYHRRRFLRVLAL